MPHRPRWWMPEGSPLGQNLRKWLQRRTGARQLRREIQKGKAGGGQKTSLNDPAIKCPALMGNDDNI